MLRLRHLIRGGESVLVFGTAEVSALVCQNLIKMKYPRWRQSSPFSPLVLGVCVFGGMHYVYITLVCATSVKQYFHLLYSIFSM